MAKLKSIILKAFFEKMLAEGTLRGYVSTVSTYNNDNIKKTLNFCVE